MWKCLIFISLQDFEKGLGATQEGAQFIFQSLKNNTSEEGENTFGDVKTAVSVFETMNKASVNMALGENLLPVSISTTSLTHKQTCIHYLLVLCIIYNEIIQIYVRNN